MYFLSWFWLEYLSCAILDVFKNIPSKHWKHVLKTSWKTKNDYAEDVFSMSSQRRMFAGLFLLKIFTFLTQATLWIEFELCYLVLWQQYSVDFSWSSFDYWTCDIFTTFLYYNEIFHDFYQDSRQFGFYGDIS